MFVLKVLRKYLKKPSIKPIIAITNDTKGNETDPSLNQTDEVDKDFTMKITTISPYGEAIVGFSTPILIPANYSSFNSSVLDIWINSKEDQEKLKSWNLTKLTEYYMTISLEFVDALSISSQ